MQLLALYNFEICRARIRALIAVVVTLVLWGSGLDAQAVQVRMATFNVLAGIDSNQDRALGLPDDDYAAVKSIIQRVDPDIVCFQELNDSDKEAWIEMAAELGYPHLAFSTASKLDKTSRVGIWSKYPYASPPKLIDEMAVDTNAAEFLRWPLHATIQIPGALNPLHVFTVHSKASTVDKTARLQRAFEMRRIVNYIDAMMNESPLDTEYAITGDFNDTIEGDVGEGQNLSFPKSYYDERLAAGGLTGGFRAGTDTPWYTDPLWMLPYRMYPTERLAEVNMGLVDATHTGTTNTFTRFKDGQTPYRLDYILFSDDIIDSAYGAPVAEVYNSAFDGPGVGLPKPGALPATNATADASDHFMVFSDFYIMDAAPGITPVAILSEVVHHPGSSDGTFVEIANTGNQALDLDGYALAIYADGSTSAVSVALSGSIPAGGAYVLASSLASFESVWGVPVDQIAAVIGSLNGNDAVALVAPSGEITDVFGVPGALPGAWDYFESRAVRNLGVSDPHPQWDAAEWTITAGVTNATPGVHQAISNAVAYISTRPALVPLAPQATNDLGFSVGITANVLASNLVVTAVYQIERGDWQEAAMTLVTGEFWRVTGVVDDKEGGEHLDYYIRYTYEGPEGVYTNFSSTNQYVFPVIDSLVLLRPMFNEVSADDAGTDDREYAEIIAPAGLNLAGYRIEHRDAATNSAGLIWSFTFTNHVVAAAGVFDRATNELGFVVFGMTNEILGSHFILPGNLQNGPDALILYDPEGNILDAVMWGANTSLGLLGTVATNIPPGSRNYAHSIGADSTTDTTLQAPNAVITTSGIWSLAAATPGTLNVGQTNYMLSVSYLDVDQDGILDHEDNCPWEYNPTQVDTDGDGTGDACDPDIDGDGILNGADNCVYVPNAGQEDLDADGIGDTCDPDIDGDGVGNESDYDPFDSRVYENIEPTSVVLYYLRAGIENDQVVIRWQTASEDNTAGFWLEREENGNWVRVQGGFVYSEGANGSGASYTLVDAGASPGGTYHYRLVEIETDGTVEVYGPFERTASAFEMRSPVSVVDGRVEIRWLSRADEVYEILRATNLMSGFEVYQSGIVATPPENTAYDDTPADQVYYRVRIEE